ncbi:putative N-acetylglucosamine-6-phosphate deacetylase [Cladophialophora carrionii]|uniref:N-acetylglucosamine-6-phosphate deacetylase n=1 Tax=Cladophialophora carrionii TaxID=86049 RepID=A0A1C1CNW5_9EURO|nr:putative N-acetylglucosamine-6-phosphate deacetylase [Cladophialophora carrionii]
MHEPTIRFTRGVLAKNGQEVEEDLYISQSTGKIVEGTSRDGPVVVEDLGGRILAPGLIEVQLNGAMGFNFSEVPESDIKMGEYANSYTKTCQGLIKTGVTSFLPTVTTAPSDIFKRVLPYLAPNGHLRDPYLGSESMGAHCEGPFISASRKGAHVEKHLQSLENGWESILHFYGPENFLPLPHASVKDELATTRPATIKKLTVAPELEGMVDAIRHLTQERQICCSIGHTAATYEVGLEAVRAGATMITHLFNAMAPLLHRSPGIPGLIGAPETDLENNRPSFGLIADDVHVSPSCVRTAWAVHEKGCILTTDGTAATGIELTDGVYPWKERRLEKRGRRMFLEGTDTIAGG